MLKVFLLIFVVSAVFADEVYLKVETDAGELFGKLHENTAVNVNYFGFKGIPYAQPPVGDLRFRGPLPPLPWTGLRNATNHGPTCNNAPEGLAMSDIESEDCLFLNVYTTNIFTKKPVMFWIHGGGFRSGSGDSSFYGPGYLLLEDVVVVTINYRLGAFGFLSTGDKYAQGNAGLKDQVMALKWVQRNIGKFGGDPENVSVFGQNAGSASVHYLIASPLAEGLFAKAILQSGVILSQWAWQPDPLAQAKILADSLNITYTTNEELVAGLRNVDARDIIDNSHGSPIMGAITFAPTVDSADSEEEIFISQTPYEILRSGSFKKIPIMMGFTNAEALTYTAPGAVSRDDIDLINANPYLLIPDFWNIERDSVAQDAIVQRLLNTYFGGQNLSLGLINDIADFFSDQQLVFPIDLSSRFHATQQDDNVFYYNFRADESLNIMKLLSLIFNLPGAVHGDDLFYIWDVSEIFTIDIPSTDPAILVRERMVRFFTNFAKYSNPTPVIDDLIDAIWLPINGNQEYMNINVESIPGTRPYFRIEVWQYLFDTYANPSSQLKL